MLDTFINTFFNMTELIVCCCFQLLSAITTFMIPCLNPCIVKGETDARSLVRIQKVSYAKRPSWNHRLSFYSNHVGDVLWLIQRLQTINFRPESRVPVTKSEETYSGVILLLTSFGSVNAHYPEAQPFVPA